MIKCSKPSIFLKVISLKIALDEKICFSVDILGRFLYLESYQLSLITEDSFLPRCQFGSLQCFPYKRKDKSLINSFINS